jgi:hypothetical protein
MAYKTKSSPMMQTFGVAGIEDPNGQITPGTTPQSTPVPPVTVPTVQNPQSIIPQPSIPNPSSQGTRVPAAASIIAPRPATVRPSRAGSFNSPEMISNTINPKAFSNSKAISGVYGRANKGTFTRTVQNNESPMMQLANPGMLQDGPQLPPQEVQTSVTPTLGFENS